MNKRRSLALPSLEEKLSYLSLQANFLKSSWILFNNNMKSLSAKFQLSSFKTVGGV